jgi:hypothetical protein
VVQAFLSASGGCETQSRYTTSDGARVLGVGAGCGSTAPGGAQAPTVGSTFVERRTVVDGDLARVSGTWTWAAEPSGVEETRLEATFVLVRVEGAWLIDDLDVDDAGPEPIEIITPLPESALD